MRELKYTSIEECKAGTLLHFKSGLPVGVLISKVYTELKGYKGQPYWFWMLGILTTEGDYFDIELGEYDLYF